MNQLGLWDNEITSVALRVDCENCEGLPGNIEGCDDCHGMGFTLEALCP